MKIINAELLIDQTNEIFNDAIVKVNESAKAKDDDLLINVGILQGIAAVKRIIEEVIYEAN